MMRPCLASSRIQCDRSLHRRLVSWHVCRPRTSTTTDGVCLSIRLLSVGFGVGGLGVRDSRQNVGAWRMDNTKYHVQGAATADTVCAYSVGGFPNAKKMNPLAISGSEASETAWRRGCGVATQYRENRASSMRNNQTFRHERDFFAISRSAEPTGHFNQEPGSI